MKEIWNALMIKSTSLDVDQCDLNAEYAKLRAKRKT